jgi:hypothetical protein
MNKTSWTPTKKWLAALVGLLIPIMTSGLESGFDKTERDMALTAVVGLAFAYLKGNDPTPTGDGVPAPASGP